MVRPEANEFEESPWARCIWLAGESPVAVSAGAPCSRLRFRVERPGAKRSVKSPQRRLMEPCEGSNVVGPMPKGVNPAAS